MVVSGRTWYSWWLLKSSTSTVLIWLTYRCRSNSWRILVRSAETGRFSEYMVWTSGACRVLLALGMLLPCVCVHELYHPSISSSVSRLFHECQ
jgi:hypothetical protein